MATIKMADFQNTVLTKTSEKLFWVSLWNSHYLLVRGYSMQKKLSSLFKVTDFQNGRFEA